MLPVPPRAPQTSRLLMATLSRCQCSRDGRPPRAAVPRPQPGLARIARIARPPPPLAHRRHPAATTFAAASAQSPLPPASPPPPLPGSSAATIACANAVTHCPTPSSTPSSQSSLPTYGVAARAAPLGRRRRYRRRVHCGRLALHRLSRSNRDLAVVHVVALLLVVLVFFRRRYRLPRTAPRRRARRPRSIRRPRPPRSSRPTSTCSLTQLVLAT